MNIHVVEENSLNINRGIYADWIGNTLPDVTASALIAEGAAFLTGYSAPVISDAQQATEPEIIAGTSTTPMLTSPEQLKLAAQTHGGGVEIAVTANRNAALTDANNVLTNNTANNYTVTILLDTVWTQNQIITKYRTGAGTLSFAAGAGVTFEGTEPTDAQYSHIGLRYRGAGIWAWI